MTTTHGTTTGRRTLEMSTLTNHGTDTDTGEEPTVVIRGTLDAEETAALTAVLQALAVQAGDAGNGGTGPDGTDRTLDRRRRLGLWARPGSDSWRHAAGAS
ncbi:acyl-CoA carboxylase subunit epsilon [Citricoccus sp.]|uniref:acyl-CoA carboxylase subunit epsilon n=2 Tax=Micrococcales TaxID=85006 RepID=UPI00262C76E2|nr:acyl-CoA carboxylase subunit epsilon [Citricoccus sp.]HRO30447.1 acyl-CoA carboxylase subunit epsilon [Citricoccus sp.]HRO92541.1 acyl-CoA carboxylase subunit epsilon [Citricoccus sp.]